MKGLKVFLIILFVVVILFVISTIFGLTSPNDQNLQTPGWLSGFGAIFGGSHPLTLNDLSPTPASCLQQGDFVVPVQSTCTLAIRQSAFTQRVARIQLVQGASATVTLTQEQTLPAHETLTGAGAITTTDLTIYSGKAHGVLEISCLKAGDAAVCLLKLT